MKHLRLGKLSAGQDELLIRSPLMEILITVKSQ